MKLVLKLPKDKPPFIGVQFANSYTASKTNEDVFYYIEQRACRLILEPRDKHTINLQLKCEDVMLVRQYKDLDYSAEKLRTWLTMVSNVKQFNFGHVILEFDNHKIVKAGAGTKNFVIKVESVKLLSEEL